MILFGSNSMKGQVLVVVGTASMSLMCLTRRVDGGNDIWHTDRAVAETRRSRLDLYRVKNVVFLLFECLVILKKY